METQASSNPAQGHVVMPQQQPMEAKSTFRKVFEAEESPLLRYAYGFVGQRETAEDLVQDAFLKLHAHWNDVANPRAWLFRCVRNLALNHIRDHRREYELDPNKEWQGDGPNPEQVLGRLEAVGTLQLLVAELQADDRQLIELKYQDNLKYQEISERTGISVGNVGYKLHHTLKRLADSLRSMGIESAGG